MWIIFNIFIGYFKLRFVWYKFWNRIIKSGGDGIGICSWLRFFVVCCIVGGYFVFICGGNIVGSRVWLVGRSGGWCSLGLIFNKVW